VLPDRCVLSFRSDARETLGSETAQLHHAARRCGSGVAARGKDAAAGMPVVGFLRTAAAAGSAHLVSAFWEGLDGGGFYEGQNLAVEYRWADDQPERVPGMAVDLVRRQVAVIVTNGIAVPAVKAATTSIPIIFLTGYDPVRAGFVTSLSRPSGNLTGVVFTV